MNFPVSSRGRAIAAALAFGGLLTAVSIWSPERGSKPDETPHPVASDKTPLAEATSPESRQKPQDNGPPAAAPAPLAAAAASPAAAPVTPLPVGEAAHEAIHELSITYDPAAVPSLARFLAHSDPEVRAAACEGLVALGERAAIPFLQDAARRASAEEATALREAAEFLALPTWTERRAALKAKSATTTPAAPRASE